MVLLHRLLADLTLLVHLGFILFVTGGALLVFFWPRIRWFHLPCFLWGLLLSVFGWTCPLTPLEKTFRGWAQQNGYHGGFIEHYLLSIVYPEGLTQTGQWMIAGGLLAINLLLYGIWVHRRSPADPGA